MPEGKAWSTAPDTSAACRASFQHCSILSHPESLPYLCLTCPDTEWTHDPRWLTCLLGCSGRSANAPKYSVNLRWPWHWRYWWLADRCSLLKALKVLKAQVGAGSMKDGSTTPPKAKRKQPQQQPESSTTTVTITTTTTTKIARRRIKQCRNKGKQSQTAK